MPKKASSDSAFKQRAGRPKPAPIQSREPAARSVSTPPVTGARRWVARLAVMVLIPSFFLGALEMGLRLFHYGYSTSFFQKMEDGVNYTANRCFGWQFFPRATSTYPHPFLMPVEKQTGTQRIFILGESAALGTPAPAFGFGRILEVMLREQFPNRRFEVINAAMRGVDSNIILPIAKECATHQPDLFLVYMGNNDAIGLYAPEPGSHNFGSRRWLLRAGQRIKRTKLYQLLEPALHKIRNGPARPTQDMEFFRKHYFAADAPGRQTIYANFEANLDQICNVTHRSGARTIVSTVGVNLKDFPPLGSLHRTGLTETDKSRWETAFNAGIAAEAVREFDKAIASYVEAGRIDDHFAELHFRLARSYFAAGEFAKASEHYQLSRDWDALQFRTDGRLNQTVRDIAARQQGRITLVDAERALAESPLSEHQIPGSSLFNDHVHLSFDGDYLLARTFFPAVVAALGLTNGVAATNATPFPSRAECAERLAFTSWEEAGVAAGMLRSLDKPPFVGQLEHRERHASTQQALQQRFSVLSQKEQVDQIKGVCRAAMARNSADWQLHFSYANFLSEIRDFNAAAGEFQTVVNIFPKLEPFRLALADALVSAGKPLEALEQLSQILRLDPQSASAKAAIAQIQANSSPFRNRGGTAR